MSIRLNVLAVAVAALTGAAGAAQAQPEYGYGQLPPAPYQEVGGGYEGGCNRENFTLLGAHAGVTVLGVDLGASAHLGVPVDEGCGGYAAPAYAPRPYAPPEQPANYGPPPPYAYAQQGYQEGYQGYAEPSYAMQGPPAPGYGYAPMAEPMQQGWGYAAPCGCAAPRW